MPWSNLKDEFQIDDIGARLLANLAKGIYSHEAVLREYVQNAADAYEQLRASGTIPSQPRITITVEDGNSLSIHDTGVGMNKKGIREAKKIAVSPKANANLTGFRGIGIWAGFQACDRLEIFTTKKGDSSRYRLTIDFKDILANVDKDINIKQLLDNRFRLEEDSANSDEHYTQVTLQGIHSDYARLLDPQELRRIVAKNLPCRIAPTFKYGADIEKFVRVAEGYQEYPIMVGKDEVFKAFPDDVREPEFDTLKEGSVEIARVWWSSGTSALKTEGHQYRSFRLRVRNFAVGDVGIYDDEDGLQFGIVENRQLKNARRLQWFVGEIHITNDKIVPDTPRSQLELDTLSRSAISKIRGFYGHRIAEAGALAELNSDRNAVTEAQKLVAQDSLDAEGLKRAAELLVKLRAHEKVLTSKAPADFGKRKLRELLSDPDLKQARHATIKELTARLPHLPSDTADSQPTGPKDSTGKDASPATKATGGKESSSTAPPNLKMEQLLSDILALMADKLDDEDLVTEVSQELQSLFEKYELL